MSKIWTIKEILNWTSDYFKEKEIDAPRLTAELLLAKVLRQNRLYLYTNFNQPLNKTELSSFKALIQRRISGEPTAYITGEKEFWSLRFRVNKSVLIPRPETEVLVEQVVNYIKVKDLKNTVNILDIGTGSGNIAVSLASEIKNAKLFALDKSFHAVITAKENAKLNNCDEKIFFINGDTFYPFKMKRYFDIIVSNPPYIKSGDIKKLQKEVRNFEPLSALDGGEDGLCFYEEILKKTKFFLKNRGKIFFEFGLSEQGNEINKLMIENDFQDIKIVEDYSGNPRVISGVVNL